MCVAFPNGVLRQTRREISQVRDASACKVEHSAVMMLLGTVYDVCCFIGLIFLLPWSHAQVCRNADVGQHSGPRRSRTALTWSKTIKKVSSTLQATSADDVVSPGINVVSEFVMLVVSC